MPRRWRVYHHCSALETGELVELSPEESHHISRVLRLQAGESLGLFNGRGREWLVVLVTAERRRSCVRVEEEILTPVEAALHVELFQGLCRPERLEWIVQKATELGVAAIHPTLTESRDAPAVTAGRLRRLERIAVEACKQSGRRRVPLIEVREGFPIPGEEGLLPLLLDPDQGASSLEQTLPQQPPARLWIGVGPESGLHEEERERLAGAGWIRTRLGPRILRTETAGLVAAALLLHRWGDLG